MTVFANGMEISAKAQGCKAIAIFPDVCMTPPQTPATPPGVPIPYPNFGMDSDLTSGSTTVKIGGEPISKENKSKYSKCSGDEAGCAPKKGLNSRRIPQDLCPGVVVGCQGRRQGRRALWRPCDVEPRVEIPAMPRPCRWSARPARPTSTRPTIALSALTRTRRAIVRTVADRRTISFPMNTCATAPGQSNCRRCRCRRIRHPRHVAA